MGNSLAIRDRIFNGLVNELCAIKGLEFLTPEQYKIFEEKAKKRIEFELEHHWPSK